MRGCDVLDNRATYGGGVRGWAADVELVGSSVQGNQSDRGGGLFVIYSDVTMRETSMLRNRATGRDGAISALASNLEFVQCLIAGNEAPSVGGIWCSSAEGQYSAAVLVSGSTVAGNDGGELAVDAGTVVDVSNSIVWGEPARGVRTDVGEWTVEYSDIGPIESTRPGPGNVNTNPLFVDPANGDYSLLPGSPCIDAGDPGYADPDYTRLDMGHTGGPPIAAYPRLVVSDTLRHVTFDTPALLLVRNVGETAQSVLGIALPDGFATPREFPKEIAPGDSATFVIVFTGSEDALGLVAAITHTDPFQGPISIGLSGLIGGGVSGEAVGTWSESDSPYRVVGEIAVPAGETLTIEPGVDVLFAVDVPFRVEGALHTRGT